MIRTKRPWQRAFSLLSLENRLVPALLVNEVFCNPPGTDDSREYVEIYSTTGATSLTNVWMLEVEGDGVNAGVIDNAVDLSLLQTGANGMLLLGHLYGTNNATPWTTLVPTATKLGDLNRPGATTIENGNATIMLVTGFTGAIGTDYDVDNDGVIETPPWTTVIDAAGWVEGPSPGKIYSPAALTQSSGTSDGITRMPANLAALSPVTGWYSGDIIAIGGTPDLGRDYDPLKAAPNLPSGGKITPGDANFGPAAAPSVSAVQIQDGSAQRSIINTFKVTFSEAVTFPNGIATAFALERTGPTGATGLVGLDLPVQVGNEVTLKVNNTGAISLNNHSIANGTYKLTVVASEVSGVGGKLGANYELNTFRLFGDVTGDGSVSNNDFNVFRTSFGGSYFALDYDNDGAVSNNDFNIFRVQFGSSIP